MTVPPPLRRRTVRAGPRRPAARPGQPRRQAAQPRHPPPQGVPQESSAKGEGDVIFLGDSITQGWEGRKKAWDENFAPFKPVNLGIGGDQTGHVLWRITEGKELEPLKPKAGGHHDRHEQHRAATPPSRSPAASRPSSRSCSKQKPDMKILLLGVFPRGGGIAKETRSPGRQAQPEDQGRSTTSSPSSTTARRSSTRTSARSSSTGTAAWTRRSCPTCCTSARRATRSGPTPSRTTWRNC